MTKKPLVSTHSDCNHPIKPQFWGEEHVEQIDVEAKLRKTASTGAKFIRRQNKKVDVDIVKLDHHIYLRSMGVRPPYSELPVLGKEWYYKLLMILIIPYREKQFKKIKKNLHPVMP